MQQHGWKLIKKQRTLKKEYKDLKKDSDEIEEMEDGLKELAKSNEELEREYKVKNITSGRGMERSKVYTVICYTCVDR